MNGNRQWGRAGGRNSSPDEAKARAARVRRGMFVLPSLFTAGGIGLGYFAITQTIDAVTAGITAGADPSSHLDRAAIAICVAIPFDALDGRIARMTNTTSDFGKELDSLADVITFGIAPALLAWIWGFHFLAETASREISQPILQIGTFICFLYLLCGVSRLARFNISTDAQPQNPGRHDRKYFVGMPIPAAAGLVASTVHCFYGIPNPYWWLALIWIVLVGGLGFLMVSKWRFWSGKEINLGRTQPYQLLAVMAILLFVTIRFSRGALFFVGLTYTFSGIWARAAYSWSRRRRRLPGLHSAQEVGYSTAEAATPDARGDEGAEAAPIYTASHEVSREADLDTGRGARRHDGWEDGPEDGRGDHDL